MMLDHPLQAGPGNDARCDTKVYFSELGQFIDRRIYVLSVFVEYKHLLGRKGGYR